MLICVAVVVVELESTGPSRSWSATHAHTFSKYPEELAVRCKSMLAAMKFLLTELVSFGQSAAWSSIPFTPLI
jgi:hypothetical protein